MLLLIYYCSKSWKELKPAFLKKWEKTQLEKFLEEENRKG